MSEKLNFLVVSEVASKRVSRMANLSYGCSVASLLNRFPFIRLRSRHSFQPHYWVELIGRSRSWPVPLKFSTSNESRYSRTEPGGQHEEEASDPGASDQENLSDDE